MKELGIYLGEEKLGLVRVESVRGKEVFSFSYDDAWLKKGEVLAIDPDVLPSTGEQYSAGKEVFGFLGDIAPDRWGRRLIRRKEAQLARREKRPERTLLASAMTMSGASDGEEGHSYLDVAEFLVREGLRPDDGGDIWM